MVPATDAQLLREMREAGAELPWQKFIDTYHGLILRWAQRANFTHEEASDLVGDVYLRLVPRMREFIYDPRRRFRGWLRKVVRSAIADACERRERQCGRGCGSTGLGRRLEQIPVADEMGELEESFQADFSARLRTARRIVGRVRQRVQRRTWQAFELTALRNVEPAEAADRLGMPIGSVYVARCRVRAMLQREADHLSEP